MNEKCFALRKLPGKPPACSCLDGDNCLGHTACPFYKPVWMHERDIERKYKKLASLSEHDQRRIANKYYRGLMPWRRDAV